MLSVIAVCIMTLAGVSIYWKVNSEMDKMEQYAAETLLHGVAGGITTKLVAIKQLLANLSQDPELLLAVSSKNPVLMSAAAADMERIIPGAQKIRLLLPGVNELDNKNTPPMSYADLEMVRETFSSGQLPAIHGDNPADGSRTIG